METGFQLFVITDVELILHQVVQAMQYLQHQFSDNLLLTLVCLFAIRSIVLANQYGDFYQLLKLAQRQQKTFFFCVSERKLKFDLEHENECLDYNNSFLFELF